MTGCHDGSRLLGVAHSKQTRFVQSRDERRDLIGRRAGASNFLSSAFSLDCQADGTIAALSRIADIAVHEFRLAEELPWEALPGAKRQRSTGWTLPGLALVCPEGDRILAAEPDGVLAIVNGSCVIRRVEDQIRIRAESGGATATRSIYGFDGEAFGAWGTYPAARVLTCVTADAWFDPYATGFWNVTRMSRTDLRIDLRSAMELIWSWGVGDHRALAYALSIARTNPETGVAMAFEPFTRLFEAVITLHLSASSFTRDMASFLSWFTVERLRYVAPARGGDVHLYAPALAELREKFGFGLSLENDYSQNGGRDELLKAGSAICRSVLISDQSPEGALALLEQLAEGLRGFQAEVRKR